MRTILLAASAAALALSAGPSLSATKHHAASAAAGPSQPVPYAQLNAYMKASPAQRAKKDWWSGQASAAAGANASATTSASPDTSPPTAPAASSPPSPGGGTAPSAAAPAPAPPPVATPPTGEVNPPSAAPAIPPK